MTRDEISQFLARRNETWQRHDSAALVENHLEDGTVDSPFFGHIAGRGAIYNRYSQWFSSFPDATYITEHLLIDGDKAAQIIKMTGTQEGEFCGLEPTGKRFEMRCVFFFTFLGDRIAQETSIYDITGILLQLGVLKAKPAF